MKRGTFPSHPGFLHLGGWLLLAVLIFTQPWGLTAADTKHDLAANPAGFLAGALHAWTDIFTLGQLQNQAYGYLFPQGLFFLLTDFLPDWVAQRLWWLIVVGVGYSGFLLLVSRLQVGSGVFRVLAALLFALSPRTLTTLTAISSETWPVMLAPWVLLPLLGPLGLRAVALAILPVAAMGAVNATATLAACVPAGLLLFWRILHRAHWGWRALGVWLLGCLAVSLWWIGPLLVLGRYSAPFTDHIESSYVTTRWLNPLEILRGTTSWSPFVDTEREAGNLLVSEPVFVLATVVVAALGLAGLALLVQRRAPFAALWVAMLLSGLVILGLAHGPIGASWLAFLDGAGAPLRNLHKFDPLVRLPLMVGVAALGAALQLPSSWSAVRSRAFPPRRFAVAGLIALVALAATSPAWTGRLLPRGAYEEVPSYWHEAAEFLNENAAGTRTLIYPETSFARQTWGWTRDEPAQPLLEVPWAVRDAVPLIDPEAIRGLDGVMAVLEEDPASGAAALRRLGIGAVLVRHDLEAAPASAAAAAEELPGERHTFGEVEVIMLDPTADMAITSADPVRVAGGGESLALLDSIFGPGPRELVSGDAEIVTDTPMLTVRNYGALEGAVSAPLASLAEGSDVRNAVKDYPSAGPLTYVEEIGGQVVASSSAADATSFGGADPARSVTAAVDRQEDTAWFPTPGASEGQWLELRGEFPDPIIEITTTEDTALVISSGEASTEVDTAAGQSTKVIVPGGATKAIRATLTGQTGIVEIGVQEHDITRIVSVPDTSPHVRQFLFQRLFIDTGVIIREFIAPRDMTVELETSGGESVLIDDVTHFSGETVDLKEGQHELRTFGKWVSMKEPNFDPSVPFSSFREEATVVDNERLLLTGRSANSGLTASINGVDLDSRIVDAGAQAFVIPPGLGGQVEFGFAGDRIYRTSLLIGSLVGVLTLLIMTAVILLERHRQIESDLPDSMVQPFCRLAHIIGIFAGISSMLLIIGWIALPIAIAAWAVRHFTVFPSWILASGPVLIAGAWLTRAPWPTVGYAGNQEIVTWVCMLSIASLLFQEKRSFVGSHPPSTPRKLNLSDLAK
ncbi:DUF3367 domain-containing protein [Corynebacterium sp. A21]|uniref:DUF3367 domain-containing protein n=1 Tax=Corynebacterium sp. A21 TaxID=3457318 RepID=UPI003FD3C484